jgi:MarR family transcriptional regulator, transcriptional regulator for hemolysin
MSLPLLCAFFGRRLCPTAKRASPAREPDSSPAKIAYCAYYKLAYFIVESGCQPMSQQLIKREFGCTIMDVARLLKTYADQRARRFGISRAQWAVLNRIDRHEGLKQSELADLLDLQPISLTRLLDRLADNGLIERRADPNDRRANRLYLKPAARPLLDRLSDLGADMMETVLDGISPTSIERMLKELGAVKNNLRSAIARNANQQQANVG